MKETQCILEHTEGQSDIVLNSEVQKCPGNAELLRQHQQLIPSRSRRARQRLSISLTFSPGVLAVLFVGFFWSVDLPGLLFCLEESVGLQIYSALCLLTFH